MAPYNGHWTPLLRVPKRDVRVCAYAPPVQLPLSQRHTTNSSSSLSAQQLGPQEPPHHPAFLSSRGSLALDNRPRPVHRPSTTHLRRTSPRRGRLRPSNLLHPFARAVRRPSPPLPTTHTTSRGRPWGRPRSACCAVRPRERPEGPSPLFCSSLRARSLLPGVVPASPGGAWCACRVDAQALPTSMSSTLFIRRAGVLRARRFVLLAGARKRASRGPIGTIGDL